MMGTAILKIRHINTFFIMTIIETLRVKKLRGKK